MEFDPRKFTLFQSGSQGAVYTCPNSKDNKTYAIKVLHPTSKSERRHIQREIYINSLLDHPHILKLHSHFEDGDAVCLVFDFHKKGDLFDNIYFARKNIKIYLKQLIDAVLYCYSKGVIHRDLKLENILLSDDNSSIFLCDFGHAIKTDPLRLPQISMWDDVGTPRFHSPEYLLEPHRYTYLSEIWAVGGLLTDIFAKNLRGIALDLNDAQYLIQFQDGNIPTKSKLDPKARHFLTLCLQSDPIKRISFKDMLSHPFLIS